MADLILTPEEESAEGWLDLDDAAVGKIAKWMALQLIERDKRSPDDTHAASHFSAMLVLCGTAARMNATHAEFTMNGLHGNDGQQFGDWKVTIDRVKP